METTRPVGRLAYVSQIAVLLAGVLCGAIIGYALKTTLHPNHDTAAPVIMMTTPYETTDVIGGRLGGIESSDTANDWLILQGLAESATSVELPWSDEAIFNQADRTLREPQANDNNLLPDLDELTRYRHPAVALDTSGDVPRADEETFYREQWQLLNPQANIGPGLRDQQAAEQLVQTEDTTVIGGRLGGLDSADTPTDAAQKQATQPYVGPGARMYPDW